MAGMTRREALTALSKCMREMYCWCDQDGSYTTGMVSVKRDTVKGMRRVVDAVLEADARGADVRLPCEDVYAYLCGAGKH